MSFVGFFERTLKVRTITLLSYAVVLLGLYLIQNQSIVIVIGAGIFFQFSRIFQVSNDNLLYSVTPQNYMSSLGSTISVFFRLGFAIVAPLMGLIIDKRGVDGFFFSTSLVLVFVGILLLIPYYRIIKN
jgi:predicted MFS family arabinose efflux permease